MNGVLVKARAAVWVAITDEVVLSPDAAKLWDVVLDVAGGALWTGQRGAGARVNERLNWRRSSSQAWLTEFGLPTTFELVDAVRVAYAAHLFAEDDRRVESVSFTLGYATDRSLRWWMAARLGMTPTEFRERMHPGAGIEWMMDEVVRLYSDAWRSFATGGRHRRPLVAA